MAGLTPTGFEIKTQEELETEMGDGIHANVGASIKLTTDTVVGQMVKLVSDRIASLWDLGQAVYSAMYPNSSEGFSLTNVSSFTGTVRKAATATRVTTEVDVDAGVFAIGALIASVQDRPQDRFSNIEEVTGPSASFSVVFEAENTGPITAPAGLLNVIAQTVVGWNSVTNAAGETELGQDVEKDEDLRIRRDQELALRGSTTADAIAADISNPENLTGVLSVLVLHNDSDTADANGLPPHSVEAIVFGPNPPTALDNTALAELISNSKADGVQAHGTSSEDVTDSQGNTTPIGYSRPVVVAVEVNISVTVPDLAAYAGDAAVEAAVEAYIDALSSGTDVSFTQVVCSPLSVAGVTDVPVASASIGLQGGPFSTTNIPINIRQVARVDTADINVTVIT